MTWVLADNHDAAVATDDLALVANLLNAWVDLHVSYFLLGVLSNRFAVNRLVGSPSLFSLQSGLFVAVDDAPTS